MPYTKKQMMLAEKFGREICRMYPRIITDQKTFLYLCDEVVATFLAERDSFDYQNKDKNIVALNKIPDDAVLGQQAEKTLLALLERVYCYGAIIFCKRGFA